MVDVAKDFQEHVASSGMDDDALLALMEGDEGYASLYDGDDDNAGFSPDDLDDLVPPAYFPMDDGIDSSLPAPRDVDESSDEALSALVSIAVSGDVHMDENVSVVSEELDEGFEVSSVDEALVAGMEDGVRVSGGDASSVDLSAGFGAVPQVSLVEAPAVSPPAADPATVSSPVGNDVKSSAAADPVVSVPGEQSSGGSPSVDGNPVQVSSSAVSGNDASSGNGDLMVSVGRTMVVKTQQVTSGPQVSGASPRKVRELESVSRLDARAKKLSDDAHNMLVTVSEITMEAKQVNYAVIDLLAKVNATEERLRGEINQINRMNVSMSESLQKAHNLFSDRYMENIQRACERNLASYIESSRNNYMNLFNIAVKDYRNFSDAAMKFQRGMEAKFSNEFHMLVKIVYLLPVLLVLNLLLLGFIVWKLL